MNQRQPPYITFDQAKYLKENGLDQKTVDEGYTLDGQESFDYALDLINAKAIAKPTYWEVIEWLRVKFGIWVFVDYGKKTSSWYYNIQFLPTQKIHAERILWKHGFESPYEAFLGAFDYIKDNKLI